VLRYLAQLRASHAEEHLRLLDGFESALTDCWTDDTKRDLCVASASELKRSALYDSMAHTARDEGLHEIADWFEMLAKTCRSYAGRFQRALETLTERGFGEFSQ